MVAGVYAGLIQRFLVTPNEQNMEQPFIEHNIAATRRAYGLDQVEEREISGDAELTARDIIENAGTIENVRLWDHEQLLQTFAQIQAIRTYYDFQNIDNDRYIIDGKPRQVMLSVRELNTESMPNRSWVNERLTFTHGYGLTLGPVNQVTTEGLPVLFVRDLPPVSTVDLRRRPAERVLRRAVEQLRARQDADSPSSTIRAAKRRVRGRRRRLRTTSYDGSGGVPVGSLLRRLMFAHPVRAAPTSSSATRSRATAGSCSTGDRRTGQAARAVPHLRRGPLSGAERRPAVLDSGRVHDDGSLSVFDASARNRRRRSTTSATP